MLNDLGLDVTGATIDNLPLINQSVELLFRKKSGLEKLLPASADDYESCPMLQICSAVMYFFTFSDHTRPIGHSDEQRIIFNATFAAAQQKLAQRN